MRVIVGVLASDRVRYRGVGGREAQRYVTILSDFSGFFLSVVSRDNSKKKNLILRLEKPPIKETLQLNLGDTKLL